MPKIQADLVRCDGCDGWFMRSDLRFGACLSCRELDKQAKAYPFGSIERNQARHLATMVMRQRSDTNKSVTKMDALRRLGAFADTRKSK